MINWRTKASALDALVSLSAQEHSDLTIKGAADYKYWNIKTAPDAEVVGRFRAEAKTYYYRKQIRRCCYCSIELDGNQRSYDAEHILDKRTYPHFMFELNNIAVSCKTCNGKKSKKAVLVKGASTATVPTDTNCYLLVHPHLDEWDTYLDYDRIGRIIAKQGNEKGTATISICGINVRNAARLSDHFHAGNNGEAEDALQSFFKVKSLRYKKKLLSILDAMAVKFNMDQAKVIVEELRAELPP